MRIAIHVDAPRVRGNERQVLLLVRGLVERGHTVLASSRPGLVATDLAAAGAEVTTVRPRGDADVLSALRFARWLRLARVDALLVTSWKKASVAGWSAQRAGVPRVLLRVGGLGRRGRGLGGSLRRFAIRHYYRMVICNAAMVRDEILEDIPDLDPATVLVVPNGVAAEPAPPSPLRSELGLPDDAILALGVGGLEPNKGLDLLVRALPRVPGVHAVVAGGGTPEQDAGFRALASQLGVSDRLHLLGHRTDVPGLLAAADVFVLPSRSDSMPNALLEAMLLGCPAVMTDVGGVRELLDATPERPAAGWVVPVEDVDALVRALGRVVDRIRKGDPEVRARTEEAQWRARHRYDVDRMVARYEALLAGRGEEPRS